MTRHLVFASSYGKKIIQSNPFSYFSNHDVAVEADYSMQIVDLYHLAQWVLYVILFFTGLVAIIRWAIHRKEVYKVGLTRVLGVKLILVLLVTTFMSIASMVYDIIVKVADTIAVVQ